MWRKAVTRTALGRHQGVRALGLSARVCVYARIYVHTCDCICLCACVPESRDACANAGYGVPVCVGSDQTLGFESCDGCQSNARGRKSSERRQTQT